MLVYPKITDPTLCLGTYQFLCRKLPTATMVGKRKHPVVPHTSMRGKKISSSQYSLETYVPEVKNEKAITVDLLPNNIGSVQKTSKKIKDTAYEKTYIQRQEITSCAKAPANKNNMQFNIVHASTGPKTIQKHEVPLMVTSNTMEVRQIESNTISDLSTLPSQHSKEIHDMTVQETMIGINKSWPSLDEKTFMENSATISLIERYVKNTLFHRLKFISAPEMMDFSRDPRSLTQVACAHFNVPKDYQHRFWAQYGKNFSKYLNKKRADVSNAMKNSFRGMFDLIKYYSISTNLSCHQNCLNQRKKQIQK